MVETIEVGNASDDQLKVTLRGTPEDVTRALVHGLSYEAIVQLQEALASEIAKRHIEDK